MVMKEFIDSNKLVFIAVGAGIIVFHAIVFSMASCNVCYKRAYTTARLKKIWGVMNVVVSSENGD